MRDCSSLILVVFASLFTAARSQGYDPTTQTCRRFSHQSAVVRNRLYIDGGEILVGLPGEALGDHNTTSNYPKFQYHKYLLFHDLSTLSTEGMPPLITNLTKGPEVPSLAGGTIWADTINGKLYQYGGQYQNGNTEDFVLWSYDEYEDAWSKIQADSSVCRAFRGSSTTVQSTGMGYYLGGWLGNTSVADWNGPDMALNSLLAYDFVGNQWFNMTGPVDGLGRAEGIMFYLPKGDQGLLVHFGGVLGSNGAQNTSTIKPAPMDSIDIYDIAAETWYIQKASGDIPGNRRRFCAGIVAAPDNSSYEIYIYAGLGFPSTEGFGDTYILSIPSFTWVLAVRPGPNYVHISHYDATCDIINNSQMVIVGQIAGVNQSTCDVEPVAAFHNFDLGKQNADKAWWYAFRPNLTGYLVPQEVSNAIGGGPTGAATKTRPKAYGDPNLEILFGRTVTETPRLPTRAVPPAFGGTSVEAPSKKNPTGKLIAIVVPCVLGGIALIAATVLFFRLRSNRAKAAMTSDFDIIQVPEVPEVPGSPGPPAYAPGPYNPSMGELHNHSIAELYQSKPQDISEMPGQETLAEMPAKRL